MIRRSAILVLLALSAVGCASRLGVSAPQAVDLSGHWALNVKLSENPERLVGEQGRRERERIDRSREPIDGVTENGSVRPLDTRSRGNAYRNLWERAMRERVAMLSPGKRLDITQSASELSLVSDGSSTRYTFGDKVIVSVPNGAADRIAGWDGRRFMVRTSAPEGLRSVRSFELSNAGRQMTVITELSGEGEAATGEAGVRPSGGVSVHADAGCRSRPARTPR